MTTADDDTAAIATAEEFAHDVDARQAADREHALHLRASSDVHEQAMARIWAPVVAVFFVGLFALLAFLCFQTTSSHARVRVEHERNDRDKVTVWCYADPNNGGQSTSSFTGSRQNVEGICPDSHALQ